MFHLFLFIYLILLQIDFFIYPFLGFFSASEDFIIYYVFVWRHAAL